MTRYFQGPWSSREHDDRNLVKFRKVFPERPCLYDLGAAGGTPPPFLFLAEHLTVVNFEPDKRAEMDGDQQNYPVAIGPRAYRTLYLNRRPTTSSLLRANKQVTSRYDWFRVFGTPGDVFETIATEPVETLPLDEVVGRFGLQPADFLKIDVQGLTAEVLEGASHTVSTSVLGLEVEGEFLESYSGQKTLGAVHEHLYGLGFEVFRLKNLNAWPYKTRLKLTMYTGQDTFCDLVYFRKIDSIREHTFDWTPAKARQNIELLLLYDLTDAAAAYFETYQEEGLLPAENTAAIEEMICTWPGAIEFFYRALPPPPSPFPVGRARLKRLLSISPLDVFRAVRAFGARCL